MLADDSALRRCHKWQGSRIHLGTRGGVEIPDSSSSAQQELYVPVFLAPPSLHSSAFHLPPLPQPTTIFPTKLPLPSKIYQSLFLTQRRYSTGPTFLRHMKLLHPFPPHPLSNALLMFLVACPVVIPTYLFENTQTITPPHPSVRPTSFLFPIEIFQHSSLSTPS